MRPFYPYSWYMRLYRFFMGRLPVMEVVCCTCKDKTYPVGVGILFHETRKRKELVVASSLWLTLEQAKKFRADLNLAIDRVECINNRV